MYEIKRPLSQSFIALSQSLQIPVIARAAALLLPVEQ